MGGLKSAYRSFLKNPSLALRGSMYRWPSMAPQSVGTFRQRLELTIQSLDTVFPLLADLARQSNQLKDCELRLEDFSSGRQARRDEEELRSLFDLYGSDKGALGYSNFYSQLLADRMKVKAVFEIGLGSNYLDVVSNMGAAGAPGASLRAFRDFFPYADIFGADIDRRILFSEERIQTFFIDQTNLETFVDLELALPAQLDLVIDDGLHSPHANLASLIFGLRVVRNGGWVVIEDISHEARDIWQVVAHLISNIAQVHLLETPNALIFLAKKAE